MTWATVADIQTATGRVVTETTRALAAQSIEMNTGLIEGVPRIYMHDRDLYWLKLAVAYQAAWLLAQSDYLERNAVTAITQDGQSATAGNADWLTLSPQARKCLKRLSWRGMRSTGTELPHRRRNYNINSDEYEDTLDWKKIL